MMRWKYYNYAMIPNCPPHEETDITPLNDGSIWRYEGQKPLLVRWTSDFDCGYKTNWWYVIKDTPYDISKLKAKRRYEITKARRNFNVKVINPAEHCEELYKVQRAAYSAYPEKYRPAIDHSAFINNCKNWDGICFGAFLKDSSGTEISKLCGYSYLFIDGKCIYFSVQKTNPANERDGVNAALVDGILTYYSEDISSGKYICDGQRSINHETAFQDYLEKYFDFRKAYCKLHIAYRPTIRWAISLCYLFRKSLKHLDHIGIVHLINAVLYMETLVRENT